MLWNFNESDNRESKYRFAHAWLPLDDTPVSGTGSHSRLVYAYWTDNLKQNRGQNLKQVESEMVN